MFKVGDIVKTNFLGTSIICRVFKRCSKSAYIIRPIKTKDLKHMIGDRVVFKGISAWKYREEFLEIYKPRTGKLIERKILWFI